MNARLRASRTVALCSFLALVAGAGSARAADLYWTEYHVDFDDPQAVFGELFSIHRANLANVAGTQTELIHSLGYQPAYQGLGAANSLAYVRPFPHTSGADIYNFAGGSYFYSLQAAAEAGGTVLDSAGVFSYQHGAGGIYRGDFEFENRQLLIPTADYYSVNLALDEPRGHIYWVGTCSGCQLALGRANLDGSGAQTQTLPVYIDDYSVDLAIDSVAGKLYWNNPQGQSLQRSNLDGSQIEDVLSGVTVFSISIDPTPIPEPATWGLAMIPLAAWLVARRRR